MRFILVAALSMAVVAEDDGWTQRGVALTQTATSAETDAGGDLAWTQIGGEYRAWHPWGDEHWAGLGFGAALTRFDDDLGLDRSVLLAWGRAGGSVFLLPFLALTGQVAGGWLGEAGADAGEALQWQATFGPQVFTAADRSIFLGVLVRDRVARSPQILPLITVDWRFDDAWRLQILDQVDELSRLRWRYAEHHELGLRVEVNLRSWALDEPGLEGVDHTVISAALEWGWLPDADGDDIVRIHTGPVLAQTLAFIDAQGDTVTETDVDPALLVGISARFAF